MLGIDCVAYAHISFASALTAFGVTAVLLPFLSSVQAVSFFGAVV